MVPQQVSFVERFSLSQRVPYRRFHCNSFHTYSDACFGVCVLQALEKAKEAGRKERMLCKQREQASLTEQLNLDLTYCVSSV